MDPRNSYWASAPVSIPVVVQIEHVDDLGGFVEAIARSVLAPSLPPLALERFAKRCAGSMGVISQRTENELDTGRCRGCRPRALVPAHLPRWRTREGSSEEVSLVGLPRAGRLVCSARRDIVRILDGWPSAEVLLSAYRRIVLIT
jgi:hypothetical protein